MGAPAIGLIGSIWPSATPPATGSSGAFTATSVKATVYTTTTSQALPPPPLARLAASPLARLAAAEGPIPALLQQRKNGRMAGKRLGAAVAA